MLGSLREQLPGVLGLGVARAEPEHTELIGHLPSGSREVKEQCSGGAYRIVADTFNGEDCELGLENGGQLRRILEHLVVVGDQARVPELVECDDELSVVEIGEPSVDATDRHEPDVDHELIESRKDGFRKVVVEGQRDRDGDHPARSRRRAEGGEPLLELDRLGEGFWRFSRVQAGDGGQVVAPLGERRHGQGGDP